MLMRMARVPKGKKLESILYIPLQQLRLQVQPLPPLDFLHLVCYYCHMFNIQKVTDYYLRYIKETPTLAKIIDPLTRMAGFDTEDMDSVQEAYDVRASKFSVEIDRCLKKDGKPIMFLQAKPIGRNYLFKVDYEKTFKAAQKAGIDICIFTDGMVWEFYSFNKSLDIETPRRFKEINILNNSSGYEELIQILKDLRGGDIYE